MDYAEKAEIVQFLIYATSCFSPILIPRGVRRKSIRYGDLGNGKIRLDFAWGVEKVDFGGTLRQEGIKKAFFRVNFFCIEGDSSPRPNRWRVRKLCATPSRFSVRVSPLIPDFFIAVPKPLVSKDIAKHRQLSEILRRASSERDRGLFSTKNPPKFSARPQEETSAGELWKEEVSASAAMIYAV